MNYYYIITVFFIYISIYFPSLLIVVLNTLLRYYGELCSLGAWQYYYCTLQTTNLIVVFYSVIPGCLRWIVSTNTAFVRVERVLPIVLYYRASIFGAISMGNVCIFHFMDVFFNAKYHFIGFEFYSFFSI